jgi:hypothetical protein
MLFIQRFEYLAQQQYRPPLPSCTDIKELNQSKMEKLI